MCTKHTKTIKKRYNQIPNIDPKLKEVEIKKRFPIPQNEIDEAKRRANSKLVFSYRFLDIKHEAFNLGNVDNKWFVSLLLSLKDISSLTRNELMVDCKNRFRAHCHDWNKASYKYDFLDEFLEQVECVQYSLSLSNGRVHGFIIGNTFYIYWLDPHHNLYPDDRYGGIKYCKALPTPYEELKKENEDLKKELKSYIELLDNQTKPG